MGDEEDDLKILTPHCYAASIFSGKLRSGKYITGPMKYVI